MSLLRHVCPAPAGRNAADRGLVYSVVTRNRRLRFSSEQPLTDYAHLFRRKRGACLHMAPFTHHVGAIVGGGAQEQVPNLAARGNVAVVANQQASRDRTMMMFPEKRGQVTSAPVADADHAVPFGIPCHLPQPTATIIGRGEMLFDPLDNWSGSGASLLPAHAPTAKGVVARNAQAACFNRSFRMTGRRASHAADYDMSRRD